MEQLLAALGASLVLATPPTSAQRTIEEETLQFKKAESGPTLKGTIQGTLENTIKGDQTIDDPFTASDPGGWQIPPGASL